MSLHNEIAKVAYELYEKSGRIGRDVENWLEAEKLVKARYAKKEIATAAKQVAQAAEAAGKKVKETVMKTAKKI